MEHSFILIACVNNNGAIGKDNKLLYHISNDMENFKSQTIGNVVVMGKNTFLSLPNSKPLPNRMNIIITSDQDFCIDECDNALIVHSIEEAVALCASLYGDKEWFVIGGASIYKQFLEQGLVREMRLTHVLDNEEGDAYLEYDADEWRTYFKTPMHADFGENKLPLAFQYEFLKRKDAGRES